MIISCPRGDLNRWPISCAPRPDSPRCSSTSPPARPTRPWAGECHGGAECLAGAFDADGCPRSSCRPARRVPGSCHDLGHHAAKKLTVSGHQCRQAVPPASVLSAGPAALVGGARAAGSASTAAAARRAAEHARCRPARRCTRRPPRPPLPAAPEQTIPRHARPAPAAGLWWPRTHRGAMTSSSRSPPFPC
jgi:hypothetical protein